MLPVSLLPNSPLVGLGIAAGENVFVEVAGKIAPDGMDAIAAALDVVVFDEEAFALDTVGVRLASVGASSPKTASLSDQC